MHGPVPRPLALAGYVLSLCGTTVIGCTAFSTTAYVWAMLQRSFGRKVPLERHFDMIVRPPFPVASLGGELTSAPSPSAARLPLGRLLPQYVRSLFVGRSGVGADETLPRLADMIYAFAWMSTHPDELYVALLGGYSDKSSCARLPPTPSSPNGG